MSTALQAFINVAKSDVESDLATLASPPFITLLTNLAAHKGNRIAQGADVVQFVASAPAAGLALEGALEGQFLELGISWIQSEIAKAPAPATPPTGSNGAPTPAAKPA